MVRLHAGHFLAEHGGEQESEQHKVASPYRSKNINEVFAELVVLVHGMPLSAKLALLTDFLQ